MIIDFARVRLGWPGLLYNTIEALPLPLFLFCIHWMQPVASSEWRGPYYVSTVAALLTTSIVWVRRQTLNRICLGLNLYFVSGSLGLAAGWHWLNDFYGVFEATGMLIWIVAVGIASTFCSRIGFVGIVADERVVRRLSWYLLAIALAVTFFSWRFQGNSALSAYLPFIVLITAHAMLRSNVISKVPSREKIS